MAESKKARANRVLAAAKKGDVAAMMEAYELCAYGEGVKSDTDAAMAWLRRAAATGHAPALCALADEVFGSDKVEYLASLEKAAAKSYGPALASLGWAYDKARGVAVDPAKACDYYRRA